ncbi:MAG: shikimate kinase, partial [Miltoncostaeaceae bacterium]
VRRAAAREAGYREAAHLEVDADEAIEEHAGMTIAEIFPKKGEVWFRRTEETVIRGLIAGEPGVLALGGGALTSAKTRALVHRQADVVWLRASPEVAWERVSGSDRPLAGDRERFVRRAAAREAGYREAAHLEVDADQRIEDIVARVTTWALAAARQESR